MLKQGREMRASASRRRAVAAVAVAASMVLFTAGALARTTEAPVVSAFCSIAPQEFFVQRVGGDLVSVKVLVGPGQSPHTFEPTPRQMADLAESDVYFAIGLPFENRLLGRVEELGSGIHMVDTSEDIPRRQVEDTHHHNEEDGTAHDDEHGGLPAHPERAVEPIGVPRSNRHVHGGCVKPDAHTLSVVHCLPCD